MPTDAQLIDLHEAFKTDAHGQPKLDKNGNKISIGYIATFNLGNGLHLSLLHLRPSQKLRDFWRDIRTHPGMDRTVRMGNVLGNVDTQAYEGRNDHVHLQITTDGGWYNGQRVKGFAVDPTPFLAPEGQSNEDWGTQLLKTFGLI
ncbi:MAG: hypothetical protein GC190_21030 [Alphaproteobacteria bacterium]|nr:hypothetical protein [Alphaproteobacteria bacterium]